MKSIYDEVLEMLKKNKEVELYKFDFLSSGELYFYTEKVYKAEDGEKITRRVALASIFGVKYRLEKIKCVGTALIKGESFIVKEVPTDDGCGYEYKCTLTYYDINEYSFSITEAMMKEKASDKDYLYFVGKDGWLYKFNNVEENKKIIELLLSKGLISKSEDFKEIEK